MAESATQEMKSEINETPDIDDSKDEKKEEMKDEKIAESQVNISMRLTVTKDNFTKVKEMITNECKINSDKIHLDFGDDILKVKNRYFHCKAADIDQFNIHLKECGWPQGLLLQRMTVYDNEHRDPIGVDTQIRINPTTSQPYTGVCYLSFKSNDIPYHGTGWILYSHTNTDYTLVITAGHCVYDQAVKKFVTDMKIKPGLNDGVKTQDYIVPVVITEPMLFVTANYIAGSMLAADDYGAILIKKTDIAESTWQFRVYQTLERTGLAGKILPGTICGYPGHVRDLQSSQKMHMAGGDVTTSTDGTECSYQFDTASGESGSPVWTMQDVGQSNDYKYGYFAVIGIHNKYSGATPPNNKGASAVYALPNFNRWLSNLNAPLQIMHTQKTSESFILSTDSWTVDITPVMAPDNKYVVGLRLYKKGTNYLGLQLQCAYLNGTDLKTLESEGMKTFTVGKGGSSGHNRYFNTNVLNAYNNEAVVGAALYQFNPSDSRKIALKIWSAKPGANVRITRPVKPQDSSWSSVGKSHKLWVDQTFASTDINYTTCTSVSLARLSYVYDGTNGLTTGIITNVFYK
eukprot:476156_1